MPVEKLNNTNVKNAIPQEKRFSVRDSEVQGLILRVEPSGKKLFYLDYRGKDSGKRNSYKIGDANILTIAQAREIAKTKLADIIRGIPLVVEKTPDELTVGEVFILYKGQVLKRHKTKNAENFISKDFGAFFPKKCSTLTTEDLTRWQDDETSKGKKASSLNRATNAFCAMLRWARENDKIENCPLVQKKIKKLQESDTDEIIRYLTAEERPRLLAALDQREKSGEKDYLKTLVLVALNTGVRRGALLQLRWDDVNFEAKTIRLRRATAKADKLEYIPMNTIVFKTLSEWRIFKQKTAPRERLLFSGPKGAPMHDVRSSWKKVLRDAGIENFRWHDMRHDFASQLVMAGVNILTVKALLTHSNLDQTLRYAHLAPDQKKEAVDRLDSLYS
jgi:integrase